MLVAKEYRDAVVVQDAVNLVGIVRSFSILLSRILEEARELNEDTDYINQHPIAILFSDKIASLTGSGSSNITKFVKAYDICVEKGK